MSRSIAPYPTLLRSLLQTQTRQCRRFLSTTSSQSTTTTTARPTLRAPRQQQQQQQQHCLLSSPSPWTRYSKSGVEQRRFKFTSVEEAKSRYRTGPFSWKAGLLFVVTSGGLVYYFESEKQRMQRKRVAESTKGVGRPKVGGDFELVDQEGRPFTSADLKGKYSLVRPSFRAPTRWFSAVTCEHHGIANTCGSELGLLRLHALPGYLPRGAGQDGAHVRPGGG
jgi:protein SCO1/2